MFAMDQLMRERQQSQPYPLLMPLQDASLHHALQIDASVAGVKGCVQHPDFSPDVVLMAGRQAGRQAGRLACRQAGNT